MANPPITSKFYIPLPEDQLLEALLKIEPEVFANDPFAPQNPVQSYISLVSAVNNTIIYYDQAEDGYESDLTNPLQSTTEIWGDNDPSNGMAPGATSDIIKAGSVIVLSNSVDTATFPSPIRFGGGDKIGATRPLAVTRVAWASGSQTLLADALEVYDTRSYGLNYVVPVGENLSNDPRDPNAANEMFEYTGLMIMAAEDGTVVTVFPQGVGGPSETISLNEGQNHLINGGVYAGGTISASAPVQVSLLTGDIGTGYESRWFTLLPIDQLSNSFYTPIGTSAQDATYVWLHNPNSESLTVNWQTLGGLQPPLALAAGETQRLTVPQNSGAHFFSTSTGAGGEALNFYALTTVDSDPDSERFGGDGNRDHDWGMTLIPANQLSSQVLVGLGLGRDPDPSLSSNENGSPIWVTPVGNGSTPVRVLVDYNGDGMGPLPDASGNRYDAEFLLTELQSQLIFDPDGDQTGMLIYTEDPSVRLAAAWGQDPATATAGLPGFDVGTGIPPLPSFIATKVDTLAQDSNGDGLAGPGETIRYSISINNISRVPVPDVILEDPQPAHSRYVPGSATIDYGDGVVLAIADDTTGTTLLPFDEGGLNLNGDITPGTELGSLPVNGEFIVTFEVQVEPIQTLEGGVTEIINQGLVRAIDQEAPIEADTPLVFTPGIRLEKTVAKGHDNGASFGSSGELVEDIANTSVTYYFEIINSGETYLTDLMLFDDDLDFQPTNLQLLSGDPNDPLAPGDRRVYFFEGKIMGDLLNTASISGNPSYADGSDIDVDGDPTTLDTVTDVDTAKVTELALSTIAGTVLEDIDNNDTGDDPIEGVTVELLNDAGEVIDTAVTGPDGTYKFVDVRPGSYSVIQTNLPTYVDVGDSDGGDPNLISIIDLPAATDSVGNDFIDERGTPGLDFKKFTSADGISYAEANSVTEAVEVTAGETVYWRYEVSNTGNVAFDGVAIADDNGTPDDASDDFVPTLISTSDSNGNGLLDPGEVWVFDASAVAADLSFAIDFDRDGQGNVLAAGTVIDDDYANLGLTISAPNHPFGAMIFDSANPTGGDADLGTPRQPIGPGLGTDGGAGVGNTTPQGNVLILSEDGDSLDPDDDARGGTLRFDWANDPIRVTGVSLLDIDLVERNVTVVTDYQGAGEKIYAVPNLGDNSHQMLVLGGEWSDRIDVNFVRSGAITGVSGIGNYSNLASLSVMAEGYAIDPLTALSHYTNSWAPPMSIPTLP